MRNPEALEEQVYNAQEPFPENETLCTMLADAPGDKPVCALTDAITINGVLGRLSTFIQYQPNTPPTARARVKDGTLYIPGSVRTVPGK